MTSAISSRSPEKQEKPRTARPVSRRRIIERPRLTRLLDASPSRILMLVAPAGYGKTTLAQEWLGQKGRRGAWYYGSPATADVAALVAGLAESAGPFLPGASARIRDLLRATNAPEERVETLAEVLAEEFAEWPADTWLVIDDYHYACESEASERLVELLVASAAPVPFLIASRQRPAWATARKILYGEIAEFGRNALAMDQGEAAAVLSDRRQNEIPGLLALTEGWPAVIGLAALTDKLTAPEPLPHTLYDYFAEELYQAAEVSTQQALAALSLAPIITEALSRHMFGSEAEGILHNCVTLGLLAKRDTHYLLHPLLRRFLKTKWEEDARGTHHVERLVEFFVSQRRWDAGFEVIATADLPHLLVDLVEKALPAMLTEGRVATLTRWLGYRNMNGLVASVFDLTAAEIDLRRALYAKSEAAALRAAENFAPTNPLLARALITAGRSAFLSSAEERALNHLGRARSVTTDPKHLREAIWSQFLCAVELEHHTCHSLLTEFDSLTSHTADDHLRLLTGQALFANRFAGVRSHLLDVDSVLELSRTAQDPMIQSSFLTLHAHMLTLAGHYDDGLRLAQTELTELERSRLPFAIPHALSVKANALIGLKRFTEAASSITEAQQRARRLNDRYITTNVGILHARYFATQQDFSRALRYVSGDYDSSNRALVGELLALRALTLSCMGEHARAAEASQQALSSTKSVEVAALLTCATAVRSILEDDDHTEAVKAAVALAREVGVSDSLVLAYRAFPPLLKALAHSTAHYPYVSDVASRAHDDELFAAIDPVVRIGSAPSDLLTPRERDVYVLLGDGLPNRAIAQRLFISEVTVKVHVRHLFEKLGVRSRTEVALIAADEQRRI